MTKFHSILASLCFVLLAPGSWAEPAWTSLPVPADQESAAIARLHEKGIDALSWSNAVVEVSAFAGLEEVPLSELKDRLTAQDPRWDPWLKQIGGWFRVGSTQALIWVPTALADQAEKLLGVSKVSSVPRGPTRITPRLITGWTVISLTVLFVVIMVISGLHVGWPRWNETKKWLWAPAALLLLIVGMVLVGAGQGTRSAKPITQVSWLQHRWFQESLPWGAKWDDYVKGKAWSYRSYQHREGRLTEVETALATADEVWAEAAVKLRDPLSAVRIFGSENP